MHKTEDMVIDPLNPLGDTPAGPRRKAPTYYIGERYRGRLTATPDAERWPNGTLRGIRDKAARRMIRKAFGKALSRIEQKVLKARDVRLELERLATNSHEARRYLDKTLALHQARPSQPTRSQLRKMYRAGIINGRAKEQELRVEVQEHQRDAQAKRDAEREKLTPDTNRNVLVAASTHDGQRYEIWVKQ